MKRVIYSAQGDQELTKFVILLTSEQIEGLDSKFYFPDLCGYLFENVVTYNTISNEIDGQIKTHDAIMLPIQKYLDMRYVVTGQVRLHILPSGKYGRELQVDNTERCKLSDKQHEWLETRYGV